MFQPDPNTPAGGLRPRRRSLRQGYLAKVNSSEGRPLCRPSGWICLWRTMGNVSVLDGRRAT